MVGCDIAQFCLPGLVCHGGFAVRCRPTKAGVKQQGFSKLMVYLDAMGREIQGIWRKWTHVHSALGIKFHFVNFFENVKSCLFGCFFVRRTEARIAPVQAGHCSDPAGLFCAALCFCCYFIDRRFQAQLHRSPMSAIHASQQARV